MHMYAFAWHICLWQVTILTALDYNFVKVDLIISYYLVFESYFYDKKNNFFFYKILLDGTYPHDTLSSTVFFPHWLTMGRKYIQKQNEIINELCPRFLF